MDRSLAHTHWIEQLENFKHRQALGIYVTVVF